MIRRIGSKKAGEMMVKKEEDIQAQAEDPVALLQKARPNILLCKAHHCHLPQQAKHILDPLHDQQLRLAVLTGELLAQCTRRFLGTISVLGDLAAPTVQGGNAVLYYLRKGHSVLMIDNHPIPPAGPEVLLEGLAVLTEEVPTVLNQGPTAHEVQEDVIAEVLRVADKHLALLITGVLQVLGVGGKGLQIEGQVALEVSVQGVAVLTGMKEAPEEATIAHPWAEEALGGPIPHL